MHPENTTQRRRFSLSATTSKVLVVESVAFLVDRASLLGESRQSLRVGCRSDLEVLV